MGIIAATESSTLDLENQNKGSHAKSLHEKVSEISSKNLNFKLKKQPMKIHKKELHKTVILRSSCLIKWQVST